MRLGVALDCGQHPSILDGSAGTGLQHNLNVFVERVSHVLTSLHVELVESPESYLVGELVSGVGCMDDLNTLVG